MHKLKSGRGADQATNVSEVLYSPKAPENQGLFITSIARLIP